MSDSAPGTIPRMRIAAKAQNWAAHVGPPILARRSGLRR